MKRKPAIDPLAPKIVDPSTAAWLDAEEEKRRRRLRLSRVARTKLAPKAKRRSSERHES